MGLVFGFDRGLWLGVVSGVGDVDVNEAMEGRMGGAVLVCWTEIVFVTGWSRYRRIHANSVENFVK